MEFAKKLLPELYGTEFSVRKMPAWNSCRWRLYSWHKIKIPYRFCMNCAIIIKDAKFFGHITQTILSGQYVVYIGKYYEVHEISPDYGIVLRRASDLYSSRRNYRQLRTYHIGKVEQSELVSSRKVEGMKLMKGS